MGQAAGDGVLGTAVVFHEVRVGEVADVLGVVSGGATADDADGGCAEVFHAGAAELARAWLVQLARDARPTTLDATTANFDK